MTGRAKKGNSLFKKVKSKPYEIATVLNAKNLVISINNEAKQFKGTDIPIMDINSTGSLLTKKKIDYITEASELEKKVEINTKSEKTAFDLNEFKL